MSITKEQILDAIANMSIIDVIDLITMLEEKFGVSAATSNIVASNNPIEQIEEKTEFNIILNTVGANRVAVIKAVRSAIGLGLKEAKDLVDATPVTLKEGLSKEETEKLKNILEEAGASVEIK